MFKDKDPDYEVDEATGRLFNLKDKTIFAYNISETVETTKADDGDK